MPRDYDLVVIGSGAAGLTAAKAAAETWGAKVLLVEKNTHFGGDCTWHGCVPSKALIRCASAVHEAKNSERFGVVGIDKSNVKCDWAQVKQHLKACQNFIYHQDDSPATLKKHGVEVAPGRLASFVDPYTLTLTKPEGVTDDPDLGPMPPASVTADSFVVCTGAGPFVPPIKGLQDVPYITYESIFSIDALPSSLIVIGGGPIGSELAQAFRRLGSAVTIVGPIMPREDDDVREVILDVFDDDGIKAVDGLAENVSKDSDGSIKVEVKMNDGSTTHVKGEQLLVCVGRVAKGLEALNLEKAQVKYSKKGIEVDNKFKTSAGHIYACGDCIGGLQFTHLAGFQGAKAAFNALMPVSLGAPANSEVCRTTFTHPEVATVGLTESEAVKQFGKDKVVVLRRHLTHNDRAICEGATQGFVKMLTNPAGKLLGATVVASVGGEMASELGLAISQGLTVQALSMQIHSYPSWVFIIQQMAGDAYIELLKESSMISLLKRSCCARRLRGKPAPNKMMMPISQAVKKQPVPAKQSGLSTMSAPLNPSASASHPMVEAELQKV